MADKRYYEVRDKVWVYGDNSWGDNKDKTRDYLKKIWMKYNYSRLVKMETNHMNVGREATEILEWWWRNYFSADRPMDLTERFGRFLLGQYRDSVMVAPEDNIVDGPDGDNFKITDTLCYCSQE